MHLSAGKVLRSLELLERVPGVCRQLRPEVLLFLAVQVSGQVIEALDALAHIVEPRLLHPVFGVEVISGTLVHHAPLLTVAGELLVVQLLLTRLFLLLELERLGKALKGPPRLQERGQTRHT